MVPDDTVLLDARCEGVTGTSWEVFRSEKESRGSLKATMMGSAPSDRASAAKRPGVALQPVIDLVDGVDLGYEALPRPSGAATDEGGIGSLALAQHTGPAVLLVPLSSEVLAAPEVTVAATAPPPRVQPGPRPRVGRPAAQDA